MNHREITKKLGISYRQLDNWTTKGYVKAMNDRPGIGHPREWSAQEFVIMERIVGLINAGVTVKVAALIARDDPDATCLLESALYACTSINRKEA